MASPSPEQPRRGVVGRLAVVAACLTAVLQLFGGATVSAHAVVEQISPADGSAVAEAPTEVRVRYSEAVLADLAEVVLTDSDGGRIELTGVSLDPSDPSVLRVVLPELADATYQVRIVTRDRADLHEVVARTTFAVGEAAPAPSEPELTPPVPAEALARWLFVVGLGLVVGVMVTTARWPDVALGRVRWIRPTAAVGLVLVVISRIGVLGVRLVELGPGSRTSWDAVLATGDARRLPFVVVAVCGLVPVVARRAPVWLDAPIRDGATMTVRSTVAWLCAGWLTLLVAWGDHSALAGEVEPLVALAKASHFLSVAVWVGTLAVVMMLSGGTRTRAQALAATKHVAVVAALVAVGSGFLLTSRLVVSLTGVFSTVYGVAFAIKIGLLVVVGLVAAAAWFGRRVHALELTALGFVAVLGAAMATGSPPVEDAFLAETEVWEPTTSSVEAGDLLVQARAVPGRPGGNTIELRVNDTRRPAPAPLIEAVVAVDGRLERVVLDEDGVAYAAGVELSAGETRLGVTVPRSGWSDVEAEVVVSTFVPRFHYPERVSSAPIGPRARTIGLGVLVVALGLALVYRGRRSKGSRDGVTDAVPAAAPDAVPAASSDAVAGQRDGMIYGQGAGRW